MYGLLFRADDASWDAGRWWVIASLVLGTPWISVATSSPVLATVLIFAMLATALRALWLTPMKDRWLLRLPLGLYAGWLTAASGVALAVGYGAAAFWSVGALLLALLGGVAVQLRLTAAASYGMAIAWGLLGVTVKNFASGESFTSLVALVSAALITWVALRSEWHRD